MRAILGRLSDLRLGELFKLLSSAGAAGSLEIDVPGGRQVLLVDRGNVAGEATPALALALATRTGTFCFRPGPVPDDLEWAPREELMARIAALQSGFETGATMLATAPTIAAKEADPLAELRDSLEEVPLPPEVITVVVITADPRPYRALEPQWRQRGWDVVIDTTPEWPEGLEPGLLVVHLPSSATLAGQGRAWYALVHRAAACRPPVPVLWVGGVADSTIRHEAILAGVDFLIPAPIGEVGETARWFREEMTMLGERLITRRSQAAHGEGEVFREFFVALHAEAPPAEVRASLLRLASNFFRHGALYAVCDHAFESVGGFGLPIPAAARISRANGRLEAAVVERGPHALGDADDADTVAIARALGLDAFEGATIMPLMAGGECVALFIGDGRLDSADSTASLAALLVRAGAMLGL